MESDPKGALVGFAEVVKMEGEKGEWYVKSFPVIEYFAFVIFLQENKFNKSYFHFFSI